MPINIQYVLNSNPYLRKFLRENSFFYKNLIRNPRFIGEMNDLMKKEYKLNLPSKLDKLKQDIGLLNTVMNVLN